MSATPAPVVGVAGAPEVAAALREIGYTVVTGSTFREAAIAIAAQLKINPVHVVVEAKNEPGLKPWVVSTHAKSLGVILLPTTDEVELAGSLSEIPALPLPATVNDLLVMMDATPALAAAGEVRIGGPAPRAAQPPAEQVPAPATQDPFAAMMAQTGSGSAPAEVTDPFESAPAQREVTDPFETAPAQPDVIPAATVTDPFEDVLAAIATPDALPPVPDAEPALPFGVANPVIPHVPTVHDPFAASDVTGEESPDYSTADDLPAVVAPADAAVEPAAPFIPVVPEPAPVVPAVPAPAPAAVIPTVVEPSPAPAVFEPAPAAVIPAVPEPVQLTPTAAPAAEQPTSEFIRQVLARQQVRPVPTAVQPEPWAPQPDGDFFRTPGISAGGCQVVFSTAGKGGAGKTTQASMYAQTAGSAGMRVLLIDANRDQGDIGTTLRIEKAGLPTILHAVQGPPAAAIVTREQINNARPAAAQEITFDVVLAPPREYAGPRYASSQVYAKLLDYAKTRYELVVIDTQIIEAQKSDLHAGFIIPELRSGAWSAGIALYDYSAIRNAFAVFDELAALGVTPQRSLVVATRWPERERDTDQFVSQFGQYGTFVGFVGDDPNINAQKSVGNLLVGSPAVAPVVRALLHRVTNNPSFAPIEESGRRRRRKDSAASEPKRRGLFGGRR